MVFGNEHIFDSTDLRQITGKRCSMAKLGMSGGMRDLRHLCGHSQPDFGEWVGLAPSMSPKGSLMLRKKNGCKPAQKIAKNRSFLGTYMARTTCLKMELLHLSPLFSSWHRWRNSIFRAMYFQSGVGDKQSFLRLLEVHSCLVFSCFSYVWCCGCKNVVAIAIVCNISVGVIIDF